MKFVLLIKKLNTNRLNFFSCTAEVRMKFFLQITNVGILIFISRKNFLLNWVDHEKSFITSGPDCLDLMNHFSHYMAQQHHWVSGGKKNNWLAYDWEVKPSIFFHILSAMVITWNPFLVTLWETVSALRREGCHCHILGCPIQFELHNEDANTTVHVYLPCLVISSS